MVKRHANRQNLPRVKHLVPVFISLDAGAFLNAADAECTDLRRDDLQQGDLPFLIAVHRADVRDRYGALLDVAEGQAVFFGDRVIFALCLARKGLYLVLAGLRADQTVDDRGDMPFAQGLEGILSFP